MFIGTQYYRPPNPAQGDWERDLKNIKEHGLEVIRTWLYWGRVNPAEDRWLWDDYDIFFELAGKYQLKILVQLIPESAPYWFQEKYAEVLYLNKDSRRIEFYSQPAYAIGGFPGPCFDNSTAKECAGHFIEKAVQRYSSHPALYAWDVWNEIQHLFEGCFCSATTEKFRDWLREKYGKIDKLNACWQRHYNDFSEIKIPKKGQYADLIDLYEFQQNNLAEWMRWRVDKVKAIDNQHLVVAHHHRSCVEEQIQTSQDDDWLLAKPLDIWGVSCYETDYHRISLRFSAIRDSAQGKPWWLSEHTGGRTWSCLGDSLQTEPELKSMIFLALSHQAQGSLFWQWRGERFGEEAPNFGLTNQDGSINSRTELTREICQMLKRHQTLFANLEWQEPSIGIIWEPRGYLVERISYLSKGLEGMWSQNLAGYYQALLDEGYSMNILNSHGIVEKGIPQNIKVLLNPGQIIDRGKLTCIIKKWVEGGGRFIAGPCYCSFREDTYASPQVPPEELQELFQVKEKQIYYPRSAVPIDLVKSDLIKGLRRLTGCLLVESLESLGARTLGFWGSELVISQSSYGRGKAYWVGTFLGNTYVKTQDDRLTNFLSLICSEAGVNPECRTTGKVFAKLAKTKEKLIIFLHNPSNEPVISWLTTDLCETTRQMTDLLSNQKVGLIGSGIPLKVELKARDSQILFG